MPSEVSAFTNAPLWIAAASAKEPCTTKCSPVMIILPGALAKNFNNKSLLSVEHLNPHN